MMLRKSILLGLLGAFFVAGIGCGGGGVDADAANPEGAFSMSMDPGTDGNPGRHLAMELDIEGGVVKSGFMRFVDDQLISESTFNVDGEASEGEIHVEGTFKGQTIEVQAEYSGLGWNGSYVRSEGGKVFEEGELNITRGDSTADVVANWEGDIDIEGVLFATDLTFEQKGNLIAMEGEIDGDPVTGFGSVVGRSVHFEILFDVDSSGWLFLGNVNGDIDRMTGVGKQPLNFTFAFDRQPE